MQIPKSPRFYINIPEYMEAIGFTEPLWNIERYVENYTTTDYSEFKVPNYKTIPTDDPPQTAFIAGTILSRVHALNLDYSGGGYSSQVETRISNILSGTKYFHAILGHNIPSGFSNAFFVIIGVFDIMHSFSSSSLSK